MAYCLTSGFSDPAGASNPVTSTDVLSTPLHLDSIDMRSSSTQGAPHTIRVWKRGGIRWEMHRYAPGPAGEHPRHAHETYQVGYSPDFDGEYWYRGEHIPVPKGCVHVIHPGEVHAPRDPRPRSTPVRFPTAFIEPSLLCEAAAFQSVSDDSLPWLAPVIRDGEVARGFLRLMRASRAEGALHASSLLHGFFASLLARHGQGKKRRKGGDEHSAVQRVRDYLHAHLSSPVTLDDLGELAGLHPHYLSRVFRRDVGLPPYRYLTQVRVHEAARRLADGDDIAAVALATGFSDQPHLTRHFKRLIGVTPGEYRPSA